MGTRMAITTQELAISSPLSQGEPAPSSGRLLARGRAWDTFKVIPIRLFGTNKTSPQDNLGRAYGRKMVKSGNCLDTVRGCPIGATNGGLGCAWGCYAKESVLRYHRLFDCPVSMELREDLLRKDLRELKDDWVRIGVMGEPSFDWSLTLKVAGICSSEGKRVVVITRLYNLPDEKVLGELARLGVVLNLTTCSLDGNWNTRLEMAKRYRELGGRAVLRIVSFAFTDPHRRAEQALLEHLAFLDDVPVVEQPARLRKTNPTWRLIDGAKYHQHKGYVSSNSHGWYCADKQLNNGSMMCEGFCPTCRHKCGWR